MKNKNFYINLLPLFFKVIMFSLNIINTIIYVNFIPSADAKNVLEVYSLASGLVSAIFITCLCSKKLIEYNKILILFLILVGFIDAYFRSDVYLTTLYIASLIMVDYLSTQSLNKYANKIRLINFSLNILIFTNDLNFVIFARIIFSFLILLYYMIKFDNIKLLNIKNPFIMIIKSNSIYFGSLFFLANILIDNLQITFTLFQFGLSYALKIYDFQLRFTNFSDNNNLVFLKYLGLIPFLAMLLIGVEFYILIFYIVSYVALIRVEKLF